MADLTWPGPAPGFYPLAHDEGIKRDVEVTIARNGRVYTNSLPGMRWVGTLAFPEVAVVELRERRRLEAFLATLRGGANRLLLWNLLTPAPLGTLRGSPTVKTTIAQGATSGTLTNCTVGATLLRGDRIAFGASGQRVLITADATANGGGDMAIQFEGHARAAVAAATAVVWDKPASRYLVHVPELIFPARADKLPGFSLPLVEDPL